MNLTPFKATNVKLACNSHRFSQRITKESGRHLNKAAFKSYAPQARNRALGIANHYSVAGRIVTDAPQQQRPAVALQPAEG